MGWVLFPGGYKQMREVVGLPSAHVVLFLTRQMWNDIIVGASVTQSKTGFKGDKAVLARITLELGFKTEGSFLTASRVQGGSQGKFGRPFMFVTEDEYQDLQAMMEGIFASAMIQPRDALGRFMSYG